MYSADIFDKTMMKASQKTVNMLPHNPFRKGFHEAFNKDVPPLV